MFLLFSDLAFDRLQVAPHCCADIHRSLRLGSEGGQVEEIERAMLPGYSTGGGLGMGLSGSRRLMDEFTIESRAGVGTIVRIIKWKNC